MTDTIFKKRPYRTTSPFWPFWPIRVAWKIIFYKGNPTLQKFSMTTAVAAIGVGVTSLLITLGVVNGFHTEIKKRILGISPHVFVRLGNLNQKEFSQKLKEIQAAIESDSSNVKSAPFGTAQAMLKSSFSSVGVIIKAVDPLQEPKVSSLDKTIIEGKWFGLPARAGEASIVLGSEVARNLGVGLGSSLALIISPSARSLLFVPKIVKANVIGLFQSGYYEYDSSLAILELNEARGLFPKRDNEEGFSLWLGVKGPDPEKAISLVRHIGETTSGFSEVSNILSWSEINKSLFSALKLEKIMLTLVISLIIFIASITITSNLIMLAAQKTRMMGSLRSVGATKLEFSYLMVALGAILGALGCLLGILLTGPLVYLIKNTDLIKLPAEIYMIERLPVNLGLVEIIIVVVSAWLVSLAASVLPAYKITKLEVSEILRYG